jgi:hypothetical protein
MEEHNLLLLHARLAILTLLAVLPYVACVKRKISGRVCLAGSLFIGFIYLISAVPYLPYNRGTAIWLIGFAALMALIAGYYLFIAPHQGRVKA